MIGQPGALVIRSPHYTKGHPGFNKPSWIIIHGTASGVNYGARDTANDFVSQPKSTHYVVGYDGTIVQCVDEADSAWGNGVITGRAGVSRQNDTGAPHDAFWDKEGRGDPNGCTIQIETSRSVDNKSAWSQKQEAAIYALVAGVCSRWGIPPQLANGSGGITGHYSIDPVNRAFCPGPVDWNLLVQAAKDGGTMVPTSTDSQNSGSPPPATASNLAFVNGVWASAPVAITSENNAYEALAAKAHQTLVHTPGFDGAVRALDEMEQWPGLYNAFSGTDPSNVPSAMMSAMGGIQVGMGVVAIRGMLVLGGLALLVMLFTKWSDPLHSQLTNWGDRYDQ